MLAQDYLKDVEACRDDYKKLGIVLAASHANITDITDTGHRSCLIKFKDGSCVEKNYLGNERSHFSARNAIQPKAAYGKLTSAT